MSGVYLKGIEMPKDGERPYWVVIHSDGTVEYNENKGQGWQTSEAVPVPPHGDLIDRDALKNKHHWTDDYYETEYVEVEDIDAAPTVIPPERRERSDGCI